MKKIILIAFLLTLPLAAQFKPLEFSGVWKGIWINNTFHTVDSAFVSVNISETDSSITMTLELYGNVFGGKNPGEATMTGYYNQNGFSVTGNSSYYGIMNFSGNSTGNINGRLPDVPSPSIDSAAFSGHFNADTLGMNYNVYYGGVSFADGIISLKKDTGAVVPVELTSFSASMLNNKRVELKWLTASEVNNSGFEIERRNLQSDKWSKIGFIKGSGTTTEKRSYSFIDHYYSAVKISYRLKQIDFNGDFTYSKTININLTSPAEYKLSQNFPNPFNPSTSISFSLPSTSMVILTIYNLLGQKVAALVDEIKDPGNYEVQWNAQNLTSGIYFYSLDAEGIGGKESFKSIRKMILLK
jgi:hypothetical protein